MTRSSVMALVTATLHELVSVAVKDAVPGAEIKVQAPRAASPGVRAETSIYCYQVSPNQSFRSASLPLRDPAGGQQREDCVALDMRFVISFFGEEAYASERMAEAVVGQLDLFPRITNDVVATFAKAALAGAPPQPRLIRPVDLTPEYLSLEELSKLWTVFHQVAHRLSVQYVASPVIFVAPSPDRIATPPLAFSGARSEVSP